MVCFAGFRKETPAVRRQRINAHAESWATECKCGPDGLDEALSKFPDMRSDDVKSWNRHFTNELQVELKARAQQKTIELNLKAKE